MPLPAREVPPGYRSGPAGESCQQKYHSLAWQVIWTLPAHHPQAGEIHPWPVDAEMWLVRIPLSDTAGRLAGFTVVIGRRRRKKKGDCVLRTTSPDRIDGIAGELGLERASLPFAWAAQSLCNLHGRRILRRARMRRHRVVGSVPCITIRRAVSPVTYKVIVGVSWRH